MPERWIINLAYVAAQILKGSSMARSEVIQLLRNGSGMTEEQANDVIAYGLAHALLVEDPGDATRLHGTPRAR